VATTHKHRNWQAEFDGEDILGVKNVTADRGVGTLYESADADAFITHAVVTIQQPTFRVNLESYSQSIGALSGTMVYTTNALTLYTPQSTEGAHQQLGTQSLLFSTVSADGVTNPITITVS
jgi:hypothetical protein